MKLTGACKLRIAYFYSDLLNLYGDNGNVEILVHRARARGFLVEVLRVNPETNLTSAAMKSVNFVFMGGGPDSSQKYMGNDLREKKGPYLKEYIEAGGVGVFVCGAYQLLGKYYKSADGTVIDGLGILDTYTQHFGHDKPRCVGNVVCALAPGVLADPVFASVNGVGTTLVGFENHGGRTYLGNAAHALARVTAGFGNNGDDGTEGIIYKNTLGTYLHGPLFARNPHVVDWLMAKSLRLDTLRPLDDSLVIAAHTASKKLKQ